MKEYICNICNKSFKQKSHLNKHLYNKVRPCSSENKNNIPFEYENIQNQYNIIQNEYKTIPTQHEKRVNYENNENFKNINEIVHNNINTLLNINPFKTTTTNTCIYCNTTFVQKVSLNRHLKNNCKFKNSYDELEKLKEKLTLMTNNYQNLEKECDHLKKEIVELKQGNIVPNNKKQINNGVIKNDNSSNQINNGVINNDNSNKTINNNVNVQLVQFGCENIDDIDTKEALNVYSKSTGGNILSNILKLINLNEKYPQNHNICMSDLSRELVKIFDGQKFVVKKFKNIQGEIMYKVIRNTHKLVDKIENDDGIVLSENLLSKLKINNVSIKLIDGVLAEDIVRDEVRAKEKIFKNDSDSDNEYEEIDEKKERDFNLDERLRIAHLQSKQQGLIDISIERLKDEMYNGKDLIESKELFNKTVKKKKYLKIK